MAKAESLKRLTRSSRNKKVLGVCSGMAEYFNVDPVLMRVIWILTTVFTGFFPGIIAYLLAAWVMPQK